MMTSILHLVAPLQFSSREEPADADGPRGRHESGHRQVQQPLPQSQQAAATETSGDPSSRRLCHAASYLFRLINLLNSILFFHF